MNYTREQYETLYYLNKLLPYLKTFKNFEQDLITVAQKIKKDLVPGLKEVHPYLTDREKNIDKVLSKI